MEDSCEHGNELPGSAKSWEIRLAASQEGLSFMQLVIQCGSSGFLKISAFLYTTQCRSLKVEPMFRRNIITYT
jgi:hypothetical protein